MIGLCLSWCSSCEVGCRMVSFVFMSLVEKVRKTEIGLVYVLHFSPKREKSEKQLVGCDRDSLIFDILLQDHVAMKDTLRIWELLCALSCLVIA